MTIACIEAEVVKAARRKFTEVRAMPVEDQLDWLIREGRASAEYVPGSHFYEVIEGHAKLLKEPTSATHRRHTATHLRTFFASRPKGTNPLAET